MQKCDVTVEEHDWLCTLSTRGEQQKYATETAPKIIATRLVRDIREFQARLGAKNSTKINFANAQRIKSLLTQYKDPLWMEQQAMKECVATEFLDECVQATWALMCINQE